MSDTFTPRNEDVAAHTILLTQYTPFCFTLLTPYSSLTSACCAAVGVLKGSPWRGPGGSKSSATTCTAAASTRPSPLQKKRDAPAAHDQALVHRTRTVSFLKQEFYECQGTVFKLQTLVCECSAGQTAEARAAPSHRSRGSRTVRPVRRSPTLRTPSPTSSAASLNPSTSLLPARSTSRSCANNMLVYDMHCILALRGYTVATCSAWDRATTLCTTTQNHFGSCCSTKDFNASLLQHCTSPVASQRPRPAKYPAHTLHTANTSPLNSMRVTCLASPNHSTKTLAAGATLLRKPLLVP